MSVDTIVRTKLHQTSKKLCFWEMGRSPFSREKILSISFLRKKFVSREPGPLKSIVSTREQKDPKKTRSEPVFIHL